MFRATEYINDLLNVDTRKAEIDSAISMIDKLNVDIIAVRGVSGITIGSIVSVLMNKKLCIVRKPKDQLYLPFEGYIPDENGESFCILDDHINTGHTVSSILVAINNYATNKHVGYGKQAIAKACKGIVFYQRVEPQAIWIDRFAIPSVVFNGITIPCFYNNYVPRPDKKSLDITGIIPSGRPRE